MNDPPRRRRAAPPSSPQRPGGGSSWVPTIVAGIVVIAAGWFLGMGLAHVLNKHPVQETAQGPLSSPISVTPLPSPTSAPTPAQTPSPRPTHTPRPKPRRTRKPAPAPTPTPIPVVTINPATMPPATQAPALRQTQPVARRPEPVTSVLPSPSPSPSPSSAPVGGAARLVRKYIDAMRRGDPQTADLYLANGSPDESFIGPSTQITSITSTQRADGSYKVAVDMRTPSGEYYETFTVAATAQGDRILDKTAIKP